VKRVACLMTLRVRRLQTCFEYLSLDGRQPATISDLDCA
jgi:hypothetical protein